jgi:hypothetical protein
MKNIILLGDSIFDNKSYVGGGRDVITHLRQQMPDNCKASLVAVDGARTEGVAGQLAKVPENATHLFVSVGGNDALYEADILQMKVTASAEVFNELSNRALAFEQRYKRMTIVCLSKFHCLLQKEKKDIF